MNLWRSKYKKYNYELKSKNRGGVADGNSQGGTGQQSWGATPQREGAKLQHHRVKGKGQEADGKEGNSSRCRPGLGGVKEVYFV